MSYYYPKVLAKFNTTRTAYQGSPHITTLQQLLAEDEWTITRIVLLGIGNNFTHLSMIIALADHLRLTTGNEIPIFSQENYNRYYPRKTLAEYRAENQGEYESDCWTIKESLGIRIIENDWRMGPFAFADLITGRTLVFAPSGEVDGLARVLGDNRPELYIGLAMEAMERSLPEVKTKGEEELVGVLRDFAESCVWQDMPKDTLPNGLGGGFDQMVMYRRKTEAEKGLEAPEAEGLWSSGHTKYASVEPKKE